MDQGTLVVNRIGDGRRFVERFAADGNPVKAAYWAKTDEEGSWYLFVATDLVDREGPAASYRAVHASLRKLDESIGRGLDIKIVSPSNPIAKAVLVVLSDHPAYANSGYEPTVWRIGGEEVYIYPSHWFLLTQPNSMTSEEVGREILRLMSRVPGALLSSRVALKEGTGFDGVPFSIQLGSDKGLVVQFVVEGEAAPRVVRLDEIASIS